MWANSLYPESCSIQKKMSNSSSTSPFKSKAIKLSHTWSIDHFSFHLNEILGDNEFLQSSTFSPFKYAQSRCQFYLQIYPRGKGKGKALRSHFVSLFLSIETMEKEPISCQITVSVVDSTGEKTYVDGELVNLSGNCTITFPQFLVQNKLKLLEHQLTPNDTLTILCEIEILDKSGESPTVPNCINSWTATRLNVDSFSHIWRIDNFRHFLSQDESSVCSAPFTSEGNEHCTFQLELRHLAAAKQGPVSILLKTTNVHQIMVKLALLDNLGDSVNIHDTRKRFTVNEQQLKIPHFITKSDLIASPNLLNNDNLTIYCQITNILSLTTESSKVANSQLSKLTQKCLLGVNRAFGSLFQSRTFSDVQFEFANHPETLPGHKLILSIRSPVFERMFSHQEMRENQTNIVTIVDIKIEVFREMFRFIYTGTVMEIERFDEELLIAADKYQIDLLKELAQRSLCEKISPESVFDYLQLADMYRASVLKNEVLQFIANDPEIGILKEEI